MNILTQALVEMNGVEEKFRKIQENPALYGAENGLTAEELTLLEKLRAVVGEANLAATEILKRHSS